ncbi:Transient receptor potential cation channel subfamily A member 1 [Morus notabilis]|uniref:Transient receptor potential cation channel subfamily A member 1 n=1 Tax=Morus notabilis TaxID=981085 RepID=W9R6B0_9ROSA|nr:Transient receptor potential cation channel subfamily A member 1 [Morus notabilis]
MNIATFLEDHYHPLYLAALEGNWEVAKKFLEDDLDAAVAKITPMTSMTALQVAAGEGHGEFVEKITQLMTTEAILQRDLTGCTALHHAALAGSLRAAVALVNKCPALTNVLDLEGRTPLLVTAKLGFENRDLLWYLTLKTTDEQPSCPFTGPLAAELVLMLAASGCLDVLLYLVQRYEGLTTANMNRLSLLPSLAMTPSSFLSGIRLGCWERLVYSLVPRKSNGPPYSVTCIVDRQVEGSQQNGMITQPISNQATVLRWLQSLLFSASRRITPTCVERIQDAKHKHQCAVELVKRVCVKIGEREPIARAEFFLTTKVIYEAGSSGIIEILKTCYRFFPDLVWLPVTNDEQFLIHIAIRYRQEKTFNLFCETKSRNKIASSGLINSETILHLAAKLAPYSQLSTLSGAALQMQREIQWFKAVEKMLHPYLSNVWEKDGKTVRELFTIEHKELAEAGEKWMKDTSNSCMIVSTLIATFVFAAAFTVPGGLDGEGIPNFLWTNAFMVFAISDAASLFSSLTSLLMFLSILKARFAEEDFLMSLPRKLVVGLSSLFFAIATLHYAEQEIEMDFYSNWFAHFFPCFYVCVTSASIVYPNGQINIWIHFSPSEPLVIHCL